MVLTKTQRRVLEAFERGQEPIAEVFEVGRGRGIRLAEGSFARRSTLEALAKRELINEIRFLSGKIGWERARLL
jgi:hypothetical protein